MKFLTSILLGVLSVTNSVFAEEPVNQSAMNNYVLIYIATSCRNKAEKMADPVDKNVYFIEAATVYKEYLKRGVPAENIYILYRDAKPDFNDKAVADFKNQLMKEFSSSYSNIASVENLIKVEKEIEKKLSKDSHFHFVIDGHGIINRQRFYIHSEYDNRKIEPSLINQILADNKGRQHVFVGSCYSGNFIKNLKGFNALLTVSCPADKSCWLDREGFYAAHYFTNLPKDLNASDRTYLESFQKAKKSNIDFGKRRIDFIENAYGGSGIKNARKILSWVPQIKKIR